MRTLLYCYLSSYSYTDKIPDPNCVVSHAYRLVLHVSCPTEIHRVFLQSLEDCDSLL